MTYAEKFQLFVASYLAALPDPNVSGTMARVQVLRDAQKIVVKTNVSADEAALQFVLWRLGWDAKPSFVG